MTRIVVLQVSTYMTKDVREGAEPTFSAKERSAGVGAVGTAALGIVLFNEPASTLRILSLGLIVAGIIGLKLATPG